MQRRKLVENKWVTFIEDKFDLADGSECTYYHAQKSDAIMIIALDETGTDAGVDAGEESESNTYTYVVNQHRHPIGQTIWQFPIGGFDPSTENAEEAARKELLEETGVLAGSLESMGSFFADPGFTNQKMHVYVTRDIVEIGNQQLEESEQGLISKRVPVTSIKTMIKSGEMGDAWGLAGFYYLNLFLN